MLHQNMGERKRVLSLFLFHKSYRVIVNEIEPSLPIFVEQSLPVAIEKVGCNNLDRTRLRFKLTLATVVVVLRAVEFLRGINACDLGALGGDFETVDVEAMQGEHGYVVAPTAALKDMKSCVSIGAFCECRGTEQLAKREEEKGEKEEKGKGKKKGERERH